MMNTLTQSELLNYPGGTFTDKLLLHSREAGGAREESEPSSPRHSVPVARPAEALARRVDIRRFPGRTRAERVMHYVRASFPRAENWSDDAVRAIAEQLLAGAEIVE